MNEKIEEGFLDHSIRELLYAFRKNGGDLDFCVKEIREDFRKAGYALSASPTVKPVDWEKLLLTAEEWTNHLFPRRKKFVLMGVSRKPTSTTMPFTKHDKELLAAQLAKVRQAMEGK